MKAFLFRIFRFVGNVKLAIHIELCNVLKWFLVVNNIQLTNMYKHSYYLKDGMDKMLMDGLYAYKQGFKMIIVADNIELKNMYKHHIVSKMVMDGFNAYRQVFILCNNMQSIVDLTSIWY